MKDFFQMRLEMEERFCGFRVCSQPSLVKLNVQG